MSPSPLYSGTALRQPGSPSVIVARAAWNIAKEAKNPAFLGFSSFPSSAPEHARARDMEVEKGDRDFKPKTPVYGQKSDQLLLALVAVAQLVSLVVALIFYNKWYSVSKVASAAVISSLLCGLSQGLLQLIIHRRYSASNLLKYYCWGIVNGFWTVSTHLPAF